MTTDGRATSREDIARDSPMPRIGCNFLRLATTSPRVGGADGRRGRMMLWAEIRLLAVDSTSATLRDAANQLSELILRDRNRPARGLGVGNENADTDPRLAFMTSLVRMRGRLTGRDWFGGLSRRQIGEAIRDRLAAALDVVGINDYYAGTIPTLAIWRLGRNSSPQTRDHHGDWRRRARGWHGAETTLTTEDIRLIYRHQSRRCGRSLCARHDAMAALRFPHPSAERHQRGHSLKD